MSDALSEAGIVKDMAKVAIDRIERQVITKLQRMNGLWNDEPGLLKTLWDEVCVQMQSEQTFAWDAIDETVRTLVAAQVAKLPAHERAALWLQTSEGIDWTCSEDEARDPSPVYSNDVVEDLTRHHIYPVACNWTNRRLDRYYERASDQRQKLAREYRYDPNNDGYV
jgi:hypothetical protein